jgi:hypothetical protein
MTLRNFTAITLLAGLSLGLLGCKFAKRGPDKYRDDTRALLETKSGELKTCYDGVLAGDKAAKGSVTVWFMLQKDTGVIMDAKVEDASASQGVQDCVTNSLVGLQLDPPDADDGHATFTYEFAANAAKQSPAPKQSGFEAK